MLQISPLIFIQGPTGTGKSQLSLHLATQFDACIVNCDSVQAYKHVSVGSAKPSNADLKKVPHYLYDFLDYPEELTAGVYRRKAIEVIETLQVEKKPLFVVGGSGFYFQALEKGMLDVEEISAEILDRVKKMLQELTPEELHAELARMDEEAAKKIEVADSYRIQRALCLNLHHGKTLAELEQHREPGLPNKILKIGLWLERDDLQPLIIQRTAEMFNLGLVDEVQGLLDKGFSDWWPLSSVGYKEVVQYISGEYDLETCQKEIVKNTLRLAKKQRTWFKRDKDINWFNPIVESKVSWQNVTHKVSEWLQSGGS